MDSGLRCRKRKRSKPRHLPDGEIQPPDKGPFCVAQLQGKTLAEVLVYGDPTETLKRIHDAATDGGHLQLSLRGTCTSKGEHFQMSARWDSTA